MRVLQFTLLTLVVVLLAACGDVAGDPADTVERYIEAKAAADSETVTALLCSELEANAQREAMSFASVETRVEDMACSRVGDTNTVSCEGAIVATYGTEDQSFELGSYNVVQEDGEWRWCGEAE